MDKMDKSLLIIIIASMTMPTLIIASHPNPYDMDINNLNRNKRETSALDNGIVIDCKHYMRSSGIVYNNKVYFGCSNHQVYEYDPITKGQRVIIKAKGSINSSGLLLNNKLYFGSDDQKVYEYDFATKQQRIVITTHGYVYTSGVALNNKVYFGSADGKFYEYNPATDQQRLVFTTGREFWSSGVVLLNKIYVGSVNNQVYEYDPQTDTNKIVIKAHGLIHSDGIVLNNKVYFGSGDNKVYEYDPKTEQQKVVIQTKEYVYTNGVIYNNKLYFGSHDGNIYEYDPKTYRQNIIITTKKGIYSSGGVVLNNKLYFGTHDGDGSVYEYNFLSKTIKLVIKTAGGIDARGLKLNNAVYFSSKDGKVYEFVDDSNTSFGNNAELEKCLDNFNTRTSQINLLTKRIESLEKSKSIPYSNNNNHCILDNTIDSNELSIFVNNVLNENIRGLGKNIREDEYTNMLTLIGENNVLNKIKQAGTNIENIKIDKNNIETFIEQLSKNMFFISNSLNELGDAARSHADIPGSSRAAKVQGIIFKKLEEIILNLKRNEEDLFKENIKVLGSSIIEVGEKVQSKESQLLGSKIKEIGRDLSQANLGDEFILEYVGNKIEILGSFVQALGDIIKNGKMSTKKNGLVLKNIGFIIKKFIKANSCANSYNSEITVNDDNSKRSDRENLNLKIQLQISENNVKDLENKLLNNNENKDKLKDLFVSFCKRIM